MKTHTIIVLSDGETWDYLSNTRIMTISDAEIINLFHDKVKASNVHAISSHLIVETTNANDD